MKNWLYSTTKKYERIKWIKPCKENSNIFRRIWQEKHSLLNFLVLLSLLFFTYMYELLCDQVPTITAWYVEAAIPLATNNPQTGQTKILEIVGNLIKISIFLLYIFQILEFMSI